MLAYEHDSVYGHFLSVRHPGPFGRLFEGGSYLFVEFGGVTALQLQHLSIGANAENTFLDDSAGVCFGNIDIGAVVLGVDCTQVCWRDFIASVGLEAVQVSLVTDLVNHIEILISPLAGVGGSCLNRRRHLLLRLGVLCIQVLSGQIRTNGSFEMTGARFSPDLGRAGTWSWVPRFIMPWSISISVASMLGSSPSPGSFSPLPLSSASSPASRSSSSGLNPGSLPSNGGALRELLGGSFQSLDRMKRPLWSRGVEENAGEWPEQPHP